MNTQRHQPVWRQEESVEVENEISLETAESNNKAILIHLFVRAVKAV